MSPTDNPDREHERVVAMLPWYVNQTLDAEERAFVSDHVSQCRECQSEVRFLTSVNSSVQRDAEDHQRRHADVSQSLARVMNRIDAETASPGRRASTSGSLMDKLRTWLPFSTSFPNAQWGATVVAGVLVAVLGFQWYAGQPDDRYSVLSSPDLENAAMRLSVEVTADTSASQAAAIIRSEFEQRGQPIEIEARSGVYIVTINRAVDVNELMETVNGLQDNARVSVVEVLP